MWKFFPFSSALGNVRKYVVIHKFLTIASKLRKNCFQYVGVSLTEVINENELSLSTKLSIIPLKLLSTVPAVSVLGLIL